MRYHQLLLEYDRSKTAANYGAKMLDHLHNDHSRQSFADWFMNTKNEKYNDIVLKQLFEKIEDLDPTQQKKYVQWICRMYATNGIRYMDDFYKTADRLERLDTLKNNGYFKRNPEKIPFADINRYKSLTELEDFIDTIENTDYVSVRLKATSQILMNLE